MALNQFLWLMGVSKAFQKKVTPESKPQEGQELARHINVEGKKQDIVAKETKCSNSQGQESLEFVIICLKLLQE